MFTLCSTEAAAAVFGCRDHPLAFFMAALCLGACGAQAPTAPAAGQDALGLYPETETAIGADSSPAARDALVAVEAGDPGDSSSACAIDVVVETYTQEVRPFLGECRVCHPIAGLERTGLVLDRFSIPDKPKPVCQSSPDSVQR